MTTHKDHTIQFFVNQIIDDSISFISNGFLIDAKSRGLSHNTIRSYSCEINFFTRWLNSQGVVMMNELTADIIRKYLLFLQQSRNPGGQHSAFRVIRALCYWWEKETDDEYRSPIRKIKPPKVTNQPINGITLQQINLLLGSCQGINQDRDKAIILFLADTGVRSQELCDCNISDIDINSGSVIIRNGKGGKYRITFFGPKTRKALRKYIRSRNNPEPNHPLFTTQENTRFTYSGLRQVIRRLSIRAELSGIGLHDFRRFFAITMLRNGADLISISRLMGHSSLSVLQRYLAQIDDDLQRVYLVANPLENL